MKENMRRTTFPFHVKRLSESERLGTIGAERLSTVICLLTCYNRHLTLMDANQCERRLSLRKDNLSRPIGNAPGYLQATRPVPFDLQLPLSDTDVKVVPAREQAFSQTQEPASPVDPKDDVFSPLGPGQSRSFEYCVREPPFGQMNVSLINV
jgi:hypothetical protein